MPLEFILTTAGKAAIVNAQNTGLNPVVIASVGIGSASWSPTASATALNTEIKKITTIAGTGIADNIIHVAAQDLTDDTYSVREIGLFLADNTLLAVYSQVTPLVVKQPDATSLITVDLVVTGVAPNSITVGGTGFINPPASTTVAGITAYATNAETQTGAEAFKAVTPSGLASRVATTAARGLVRLADNATTAALVDTERAVTPASLATVLPSAASTTQAGLIRMATAAEVAANTPNLAVTAENLGRRVVAFVGFNGSTLASAFSFGVASVTRLATGRFRITFGAGVLSSANYSIAANCLQRAENNNVYSVNMLLGGTKSASVLDICVAEESQAAYQEPTEITVTIFQ